MRLSGLVGVALAMVACGAWADSVQEVVNLGSQQVTGVAVSKTGRMFVNFPYWSEPHTVSVAEIVNGKPVPFPDQAWNGHGGEPGSHFVCVQSVYVDDTDTLWVLDPAAPKGGEVVKGGPKLVGIDLKTNKVVQTIHFDEQVAPAKSYLNDVRVDSVGRVAFISESGLGALIVVDLKTGTARRVLDGIPATKGEEGFELKVDGRPLVEQKTGQPPVINCDGIALDSADGYVYFRALTAHTLYRIKTVDLRNLKFSPQEMEAKIEKVAETPACDGMMMGRDGNLYLTDLEHAAVISLELVTGKISTMVADPQFLLWPDTLAIGQDDGVYVSASQIENSPRFNNGVDVRKKPYCVYKVVRGPLPAH